VNGNVLYLDCMKTHKPITVFLDIDGVFHSAIPLTVETMWNRRDIVSHALFTHSEYIEIVISSTWRLYHKIEELRQLLPVLQDLIIDVTPDLRPFYTDWKLDANTRHLRQSECENWLIKHRSSEHPYIAIDDMKEWFADGNENLLLTDFHGFTYGDALTFNMMIEERL